MARQTLKDGLHRIVGYIDDDGSKQTLLDAQYRIQGYFKKDRNITEDAQFRRVGTGNLLASLLPGRR